MSDIFEDGFEIKGEATGEQGPASRSSKAAVERKQGAKRAQRRRNVMTFVVMIVSLSLLIGGAIVLLRPLFSGDSGEQEVTDYPGPGSGSVEVVVNPGDTGNDIAQTLEGANVIATARAFTTAYTNNERATQIQAGTYTLSEEMSASGAIEALLDPGNRTDITVTIPEGWQASQIYDRIAATLDVSVEDVEEVATQVADESLPEQAGGEIEGWLFASTYTIEADSGAQELLESMINRTVSAFEEREIPEDDWEEVLIKASIVEMEVVNSDERGMVARVIENRLEGCSGDGRIGMDPTYAYGLGKPAYEITRQEWTENHPYNTRTTAGLPPTPISSPNMESIDAVLSPPDGDWCYFVTVNPDTGETRFTDDPDEHQRNQEEFRQWRDSRGEDEDEQGED